MHKKVLAIRNEVKNGTVKVPYAQKTLDAIAQCALLNGLDEAKKHADLAFALMPLIGEKKQEILDELEMLAFMVAEKQIDEIEKKLLESIGGRWDDREHMRDNGCITEHLTKDGNIFVWLLSGYSDTFGDYKHDKVGIVGLDGVFDVDQSLELADIMFFIDEKMKKRFDN